LFVNVAFEGGGIKGLAYIGAIKCLEDYGIKIFKASGTSVGSIFASLVVAGYKSFELEEIIEQIDVNKILKKNSLTMAIKSLGMNNIDNLEKMLNDLLEKKGLKTFKDVKHGNDYLLKMIVVNYKTRSMLVLPEDFKKINLYPDNQEISKAVAMSCSMPGIYSVYKYKDKFFGDGGIVNNFPVDVLDNSIPIFAFRLKEDGKASIDNLGVEKGIHIISIDTLGIKTIDFKKGLERRKELYRSGYECVKRYIEWLKRNGGL